MRVSDKKTLSDVMHHVMEPVGAKSVAADLDMPYSTLMGEINGLINPDSRNKLGTATTIEILEITKNPEPFIDWITRRFGFNYFKTSTTECSRETLYQLVTRASKEFGDVSAAILAAFEDGKINMVELDRIAREVREASSVLQALLETSRKAMTAPVNEHRHE